MAKILHVEEWDVTAGRRIFIHFELGNGDEGFIEFTLTPEGKVQDVSGGGFYEFIEDPETGKKIKVK